MIGRWEVSGAPCKFGGWCFRGMGLGLDCGCVRMDSAIWEWAWKVCLAVMVVRRCVHYVCRQKRGCHSVSGALTVTARSSISSAVRLFPQPKRYPGWKLTSTVAFCLTILTVVPAVPDCKKEHLKIRPRESRLCDPLFEAITSE